MRRYTSSILWKLIYLGLITPFKKRKYTFKFLSQNKKEKTKVISRI